jgi:tRNA(Arg) A34 adenosine deaminase TadA
MRTIDRRSVVFMGIATVSRAQPSHASNSGDATTAYLAEAFRMKERAVANGDQPYGAVVVVNNKIVGFGPSRVIIDRDPDAHAERIALWDAQRRLGTENLNGGIIYSTSLPCAACQSALAQAHIARMVFGPAATNGGKPLP